MKEKSPCEDCKPPIRQPGCRAMCKSGREYWARQQEQNEIIRQARNKERSYNEYKGERVFSTKKRYGIE